MKKYVHIAIIVLGIIFISLGAFHTNIWFDEAYSVGMASKSFSDIWLIGGNDVHPVMYYWFLHIIYILFGNKIILYRLLGIIATAILSIIGFTHIRKDFGEDAGILFSFFILFLPINVVYSVEIRMYTCAMLFVTLMAIYAYRIYLKSSVKNWIIFAIFSLLSAYTHYYGLMTAGIINIMLFIWALKPAIKEKTFTTTLKSFIIQAVIQIALYLPWVLFLLLQISQVSAGFWIGIKFPDTLIEMFTFQFTGNLGGPIHISNWIAGIYGISICIYLAYIIHKNKKSENRISLKPAKLAIIIYSLVILSAIIVSLIIWRPIIYARYLLVITGLLIFAISYCMSKIGLKYINIAVCIITVIIATIVNIDVIQKNYDKSNNAIFEYLEQNITKNDLLIYSNDINTGFIVGVTYPDNKQYFWNRENWNVEEAYKAFSSNMEIIYNLDKLENYTGRILAINENNTSIADAIEEKYNIEIIDKKTYKTKYQDATYSFVLMEKK